MHIWLFFLCLLPLLPISKFKPPILTNKFHVCCHTHIFFFPLYFIQFFWKNNITNQFIWDPKQKARNHQKWKKLPPPNQAKYYEARPKQTN
jgi:uncharacterized membrane protein